MRKIEFFEIFFYLGYKFLFPEMLKINTEYADCEIYSRFISR